MLDHAGVDAAHVVGHAIGGIVGIELALRHPKRLRSPRRRQRLGPRRSVPAALLRDPESSCSTSPDRRPMCARSRCSSYPPQWISENIAHLSMPEEERILKHFPPVATMNRAHRHVPGVRGRAGAPRRRSTCRRCCPPQRTTRWCRPISARELALAIPDARVHEVGLGRACLQRVSRLNIFNGSRCSISARRWTDERARAESVRVRSRSCCAPRTSASPSTANGRPVEAIRKVDFELRRGADARRSSAPSGCGKSALFNAIAGLLRPTRGHVEVGGRRVDDAAGHVGCMLHKDRCCRGAASSITSCLGWRSERRPRHVRARSRWS